MKKTINFLNSKKWYILFGGIFFFLLFLVFSYIVHRNVFVGFDFDTTVRLQDHMSRRFVTIFSFFSDIGEFEVVTASLVIIIAIYAFLKRKWLAFVATFFFYGTMHLIEIYGKTFVHHLPPPHFLLLTQNLFNFPQYYVQATNSYPSGHAGRALFVTAFLGVMIGRSGKLNRIQKILLYVWIVIYDIIMLTSRIYLGEHWTSDVIGGSLLGFSFGLFAGVFL